MSVDAIAGPNGTILVEVNCTLIMSIPDIIIMGVREGSTDWIAIRVVDGSQVKGNIIWMYEIHGLTPFSPHTLKLTGFSVTPNSTTLPSWGPGGYLTMLKCTPL